MSENQNIEWKVSWRDDYLKWICGFANAGGGCWFEFPFSADYLNSVGAGEAPGDRTARATQKTTQKAVANRILDVVRNDASASRRRIAELLGDITEDGVKYHLEKLKESGRIRRIGPDRGGRWEVLENHDE